MNRRQYFYLFIIISSISLCQEISYNEEFQINTYTDNNQFRASVSGLTNDGFVVCWESREQDGSSWGIYSQLYALAGIKVGDEFLVNSYTYSSQEYADVSALSNGKFIICWQSSEQDGDGSGIFAQLFDAGGNKIAGEFQVNSYTNDSQNNPCVTDLLSGGFVICWRSWGQDGSGYGIYAQLFDSTGIKIGNEFLVNTQTAEDQYSPNVSKLSNGGFVIAWQSNDQNSISDISAQIFDANGNKIGEEFRVNTYLDSQQRSPAIASLLDSGFVICWESSGQDGNGFGVYAKMYDAAGTNIGNEFLVNTHIPDHQLRPDIASFNDGSFVISWESYNQDTTISTVYAQLFGADGMKIGHEFKLNSYSNTYSKQNYPVVSNLSNGGFITCWTSWDQDGSLSGIFGKYYLGEILNHNLTPYNLLAPHNNDTLKTKTPHFNWSNSTLTHINFPWELRYELYIDIASSFSEPFIKACYNDTSCQITFLPHGQTYYWKVLARDYYGDSLWSSTVNSFTIDTNYVTNVNEIDQQPPSNFQLFQNFPNPFNPTTKIKFCVPASIMLNSVQHLNSEIPKQVRDDNVRLVIYDILGNEIATLVNEQKQPGTYEVEFNGGGMTSGVYLYKLSSGKFVETKKMLLIK